MRLYSILIPVLISGVISSGMAEADFPSGLELVCQSLRESGRNPVDLGIDCNSKPGNVETFLREKCAKNGSPSSYKNAKEGLDFFSSCVQLVVDIQQIPIDIQATQGSEELLRNVYRKYCLRAPVLKECTKYATNNIGSCLQESEERKSAEIVYNMANKFFDFVCWEEGLRFAVLENPDTIRCVTSKGEAMLNCVKENFGNYLPNNTSADVGGSQGLGRLARPLIPSTEDCGRLDRLQNCTVELLAECDSHHPNPANLLNSMFNSMKSETPCESLLETGGWEPTDYIFPENETEIFNATSSPEYEDVSSNQTSAISLREKCEANGAPGAYETAKNAPQILENCLESVINTTQLQAQLNAVAPFTTLDFLFAKHCREVPNLNKCVKRAVKSIKPCMDPEARDRVNVVNKVTRALLRFSCQDNGARIAAFVTSGGPQCMESKKEALQHCANEFFSGYSAAGSDGSQKFEAALSILTEDCSAVQKFRQCTVEALQECGDPTNAKMVGSLIKALIKATPCKHVV